MKKLILVLAAVLAFAVAVNAQPRALGVRVGWGAELSYQHTLGAENFAELDLGWSVNNFRAAAAYDFSIAPIGPLNFYAGPQVNLGFSNVEGNAVLEVGAGAQLGIEYCFDFPLQLSLDWRPTFYFLPGTAFGWQGIALGIRYLF